MKPARLMPNGMQMIKHNLTISPDKKIYFASDQHFGLDVTLSSKDREQIFVNWLEQIKPQTEALFLLGDMFDFWYEYKRAVPKGFIRVLGKLAEFTDTGIPVYFFTGNHDMWMRDYLTEELNMTVFFNPQVFKINDKMFYLGHGDGLGPSDKKYKLLKKIFTNRLAQWAYRWLHPDIGLKLAQYLSQKNKLISGEYAQKFKGKDKEWLYLYSKNYLNSNPDIDYFVFGHRHLPLEMPLNDRSVYYNTGDWLTLFTYLEFDGDRINQQQLNLK